MTTIEHREIKGITIKNIMVTIISTVSIVISVMTSYFQLKGEISNVRATQETTTRVNEVRLKVLESQVGLLQQEVNKLKDNKKP